MVSKAKLYSKLDDLQDQLIEEFLPHLRAAASGKNDLIFCVKQFNTFSQLKLRTDKITEACIELGSQILSLKEKLGESSAGSVAERLCWYCREWSKPPKYKESYGTELAKAFLSEIVN